jgi:hypothetical protein
MFGSPFHDYREPPVTSASGALLERLAVASRQENQAAAGQAFGQNIDSGPSFWRQS